MRRGHANDGRRRGFTLIELLVVIAIIGVLMSLLLAAVMKTIVRIEEVKTRNDISQLDQAIAAFKTKYKVDYIPSRIVLRNNLNNYLATPIEVESKAYLLRVWTRLDTTIAHNWGGTDGRTLYGHQCLVFFLGGIPSGGACTGFSTNPTRPDLAGGERVTFYDFQTNRLFDAGGGYLAYKDGYGKKPYAYFSAYKTANGYNRYGIGAMGDCQGAGGGGANPDPNPYAELWVSGAPSRYLNPDSHQIISAGQDATFGTGTINAGSVWTPRTPGLSPTQGGFDDMSNFTDRFLGIPVN